MQGKVKTILKKAKTSLEIGKEMMLAKYFSKIVPISIKVFITNKCNLKCAYCYPVINKGIRKFGNDMSKEKLFELFDELAKLGTRAVVLQGGEPLLRSDFGEIVEYVKNKGILCEAITNGFFVEDKINEVSKLDSICISIDGNEEETDFHRGKGCYKKAIRAIELCSERNISIRLHGVITKINKDSLNAIKIAKKYGVGITVSPIITNEYCGIKFDPNVNLTREETKNLFNKLLEYKNKRYPVNFSRKMLRYFIDYPFESYDEIIKKGDVRLKRLKNCKVRIPMCRKTYLSPEMEADGTVYPCASLMHSPDMPNVHELGLLGALKKLKTIDCATCGSITDQELNSLLNMSFSTVAEVAKYYFTKVQ